MDDSTIEFWPALFRRYNLHSNVLVSVKNAKYRRSSNERAKILRLSLYLTKHRFLGPDASKSWHYLQRSDYWLKIRNGATGNASRSAAAVTSAAAATASTASTSTSTAVDRNSGLYYDFGGQSGGQSPYDTASHSTSIYHGPTSPPPSSPRPCRGHCSSSPSRPAWSNGGCSHGWVHEIDI